MSTPQRSGFAATDPDFAAVYAAVSLILNRQKPNKREKLYGLLEVAAILPGDIKVLPHQARAISCLREALSRWRDIQQLAG